MNTKKMTTCPLMLTIMITMAMGLTACGGGGGGEQPKTMDTPKPTQPHQGQTSGNQNGSQNNNQNGNQSSSQNGNQSGNNGNQNGSQNGNQNGNTTQPPSQPPKYAANKLPEQVALEYLNRQRQQCNFDPLTVNLELEKSATNHANYLAEMANKKKQPFASHQETDRNNSYYSGENYWDRVNTQGRKIGSQASSVTYPYKTVAENISIQTKNIQRQNANDLQPPKYTPVEKQLVAESAVRNLLAAPYHLRNLVSLNFTEIGVKYAEVNYPAKVKFSNGQFRDAWSMVSYLEMVSGRPERMGNLPQNQRLYTYPCQGTADTEYQLEDEQPNPFGKSRDLKEHPIGQPVYVLAPHGKVIRNASATITLDGESVGKIHVLKQDNDPNRHLLGNEVFFMPDKPLLPNSTYQVRFTLEYADGTRYSEQFSFSTKKALVAK